MSGAHLATLFRQAVLAAWLAFSICQPAFLPEPQRHAPVVSCAGTLKADRATPPQWIASVWSSAPHQFVQTRKHQPQPGGPGGACVESASLRCAETSSGVTMQSDDPPGSPAQCWRFVQRTELRPRAPCLA